MGQHKHNPTAIAAKNGELPPKPKKIGKREAEQLLMREIMREIETENRDIQYASACEGGLTMKEYIEREVVCNDCANQKICVDKSLCPVGRASAADVVERKRGEWIERKSFHAEGGMSAKCSVCNKSVQYFGNPLNFCPNCGADMRPLQTFLCDLSNS